MNFDLSAHVHVMCDGSLHDNTKPLPEFTHHAPMAHSRICGNEISMIIHVIWIMKLKIAFWKSKNEDAVLPV